MIAILGAGAEPARAEPLSNVSLYHRCYSQLTQLRRPAADALTVAVRNGTRTPISACLETLDRARFNQAGQTQISPNETVGQAVLKTLHKLHSSWFANRDIDDGQGPVGFSSVTRDIFNPSDPAMYYTRALLGPNVQFGSIVTASDNLRAVRSVDAPTVGPSTNAPITRSIFASNAGFKFAGKGDLLGFELLGPRVMSYSYTRGASTITGSVDLGAHYGGGILGHVAFMQANVLQADNFAADGAEFTPRKYARAIFSDLMCREIPVVRAEDAAPYVVATSSVPFRNAVGCVSCHASIDRLAYVIRGFQYNNLGFQEINNLGVSLPRFAAVTQPAETGWPSEPDPNFFRRPPNGVLYYRSFDGTLVNRQVSSVQQIGAELAAQDDIYVCAAKRYYQYFTGIDVPLSDIGDPANAPLSAGELAHRNQVITLGRNLRTHQSLRLLIEEILNLPAYRDSGYGVSPEQ